MTITEIPGLPMQEQPFDYLVPTQGTTPEDLAAFKRIRDLEREVERLKDQKGALCELVESYRADAERWRARVKRDELLTWDEDEPPQCVADAWTEVLGRTYGGGDMPRQLVAGALWAALCRGRPDVAELVGGDGRELNGHARSLIDADRAKEGEA